MVICISKIKILGSQSTKGKKNVADMDETNVQNYAPGEGQKFVDVTSVKYSEEKCFPHLFPEGNNANKYFYFNSDSYKTIII